MPECTRGYALSRDRARHIQLSHPEIAPKKKPPKKKAEDGPIPSNAAEYSGEHWSGQAPSLVYQPARSPHQTGWTLPEDAL